MNLIEKIFGTHSDHELKRIKPILKKIEALESHYASMTDIELKEQTAAFKKSLQNGKELDDILPEAFATVREASIRTLGMKHYPVQLIGGIVLHQGRIAEMRTGEGKTLVCTCPAYLNALNGKGVQVVTVNDYLAARDAEFVRPLHEFLGLTVGIITSDMEPAARREQYACDITYITNNELGFDYLRDNMATESSELVQRELDYCIIDEVDSVLIDEARTPLIISSKMKDSSEIYRACDVLAKRLKQGEFKELKKIDLLAGEEIEETGDFAIDEKHKNVNLTEEGIREVEKFFKIDNLADPQNLPIQHCIILALRANYTMFRDKDYIVSPDGDVLIVDEFTGRVMDGRRYSEGLHQAIEAKENVEIKAESQTLATVTFQSFFNKYNKKAGMTGTAATEEKEFRDVFDMDVVTVPTNKPIVRIDEEDSVFISRDDKYKAVVKAATGAYAKKQPVLIGTSTIDVSEYLSDLLNKAHIPHSVLNAKNHKKEAEIISHAGEAGSVTIATNMAGRGTDIKLDDAGRAAGGLYVIGTERHESRRIDNQLQGRSGRQGDCGRSKFFVSLEDDLMRLFGQERMVNIFSRMDLEDDKSIQHSMLSHTIENAQKKVESNHFASRKSLLDYDKVIDEQRDLVYEERQDILKNKDIGNIINKFLNMYAESLSQDVIFEDEIDFLKLNEALLTLCHKPIKPTECDVNSLRQLIRARLDEEYAGHMKENGFDNFQKYVLLKSIDNAWTSHINDIGQLQQVIHLQSFAQKDPKVEFRLKSYELFDEMTRNIVNETLKTLFNARFEDVLD